MARRFHSVIHFQLDELHLYYNYQIISDDDVEIEKCHHIEKMKCSRAKELTPDQCVEVRKCELKLNRDLLFYPEGIDVNALQELDKQLRQTR